VTDGINLVGDPANKGALAKEAVAQLPVEYVPAALGQGRGDPAVPLAVRLIWAQFQFLTPIQPRARAEADILPAKKEATNAVGMIRTTTHWK
jgi:hypothetical protein